MRGVEPARRADWSLRRTFRGHAAGVTQVVFGPRGRSLATKDTTGSMRLWSMNTGRGQTLTQGTANSTIESYSPTGTLMATTTWDDVHGGSTVDLWEVSTGRRRAALVHADRVRSVAFSPDGATLATGTSGGAVHLWDAATGHDRAVPTAHTNQVESVAFSPDAKILATGGQDGIAHLWDVATGRHLATLACTDIVYTVTFSPDGATLVTSSDDGTIRLWSTATHHVRAVFDGADDSETSVLFSPDGSVIATIYAGGGAVDPDVVVDVDLWDARTGHHRATLAGHTAPIDSAAFSPDSTTIATASDDGTVRLWNTATGQTTAILAGGSRSVGYSPDGHTIAAINPDGKLALWDGTQHARTTLPGWAGVINAYAFSPTTGVVATAGADHTARLWQSTTKVVRS
jgi:WD40 repeat protein